MTDDPRGYFAYLPSMDTPYTPPQNLGGGMPSQTAYRNALMARAPLELPPEAWMFRARLQGTVMDGHPNRQAARFYEDSLDNTARLWTGGGSVDPASVYEDARNALGNVLARRFQLRNGF